MLTANLKKEPFRELQVKRKQASGNKIYSKLLYT